MNIEQRLHVLEQQMNRIEKMLKNILDTNHSDRSNVKGNSKWITEQDAMKILDLSKKSLQNLRAEGTIRYSTASGRKIKYYKADVDAYLDKNSNLKIRAV